MSKDRYETTEKHVVEERPDGTVERRTLRDEPLREPVRERVIEPRIVKVKSGGGGAAWALVALLAVAAGGMGWYIMQTREQAVAVDQQQEAQAQQQAAMEQRLEDIGQRAADLNAEVRDAQRDMGATPASPSPGLVQPASPQPADPLTAPAPTPAPQQ